MTDRFFDFIETREQLDLDHEVALEQEYEEGFDGWDIFQPSEPETPDEAEQPS